MIGRRTMVGGLGATALAGAFVPAIASAAAGPIQGRAKPASAEPTATYDALFEGALVASPETATLEGLDTDGRAGLKHRLDDRSLANRLNVYSPLVTARAALADQPRPSDVRERQWLQTFRWYADQTEQMRSVSGLTVNSYGYPIPYAVTQLSGAYAEVPDLLANQHTIQTEADCEAYLDRLAALPRAIDQGSEVGRVQAAKGVVPPDFICDAALAQLRDIAAGRGSQASLVLGLTARATAAGIGGDWERRAVALVDGPVAAALKRQITTMEALRARSQSIAGIGARTGGDHFYAVARSPFIRAGR